MRYTTYFFLELKSVQAQYICGGISLSSFL